MPRRYLITVAFQVDAPNEREAARVAAGVREQGVVFAHGVEGVRVLNQTTHSSAIAVPAVGIDNARRILAAALDSHDTREMRLQIQDAIAALPATRPSEPR